MAHFANVQLNGLSPSGIVPRIANLQNITYGAFLGTITIKEMGGIINLKPLVQPRQDSGGSLPTGPQWWPVTG